MKLKEKIQIYENFFHQIQLNAEVVMAHERVTKAIEIICDWSYAHRVGNGENSDREQDRIIEKQITRMKEYV